MHRGYIKLYRRILDNPIVMKDPEFLSVWIYLLVNCTYGGNDAIFEGNRIHLKPGQLITGRRKISETLGISESKVQRILKKFELDKQIEQQTNNIGRLITVVNWELYQVPIDQTDQYLNTKGTTDAQQSNTFKEDKKENNERIKLSKLKNLNSEIDQLIRAAKEKCKVYDLIYNPAQERRFGHNILKDSFVKQIKELGFESPVHFVETIIDMSMQPGNRWQHKIAGLKDIHRNYPKVYAGYKSTQRSKDSISTF